MKAIFTKYHGPTNTKGSRISASDEDGNRVSIPYPHELSGEAVHRKAAETLRDKMGWTGELLGGSHRNGCYVFVFTAAPARLLAALEALDRALIPMDYSDYQHRDELSTAIIAARAAINSARAEDDYHYMQATSRVPIST